MLNDFRSKQYIPIWINIPFSLILAMDVHKFSSDGSIPLMSANDYHSLCLTFALLTTLYFPLT